MKKLLIILAALLVVSSVVYAYSVRLFVMKAPGGGSGSSGVFVPDYEACEDNLALDEGTVFSVSSYQVGPTGQELRYYLTSLTDGTLGGSPSLCDLEWRTFNEGYTPAHDGWPQGSWAYIDAYFSSPRRIGVIKYMLSGSWRYRPRAIVVYAKDSAVAEWEYVWTFWIYSMLDSDACSYGEEHAIRTLEIPGSAVLSRSRLRLHIYRADVWNEWETQCANLELYEVSTSCP